MPTGTIYQGATNLFGGKIKSSENIISVTVTVADQATGALINEFIDAPNATQYDLSVINTYINAGSYNIGDYSITLTAATAISSEVFFNTTFSVEPEPLRIVEDCITYPQRVLIVGQKLSFSGAITSNYPITYVHAIVQNTDGIVMEASDSPNTLSYELSQIAEKLDPINSVGSYGLSVVIFANGEEQFGCTPSTTLAFMPR